MIISSSRQSHFVRFAHMRVTSALAAGAFALLAMTAAAQAQGVARGAEEGFYTGGQALGPVGSITSAPQLLYFCFFTNSCFKFKFLLHIL